MPISFDSLPQDKPVGALLPKGCYQARIIEATIRTPQNGGDDYLALTYALKTIEGEDKGKLWDNFFDVDKPIPRYKLQRLLTALGLTSLTTFELKDLTKVVIGKDMLVDITTDEKATPQPRNTVDVFSGEIFYPTTDLAAKAGVIPEKNPLDDDPFIAASDSEPTSSTTPTTPAATTAPSDY